MPNPPTRKTTSALEQRPFETLDQYLDRLNQAREDITKQQKLLLLEKDRLNKAIRSAMARKRSLLIPVINLDGKPAEEAAQ